MSIIAESADYRSIVLSDCPLLDVRAPAEFDKGALPTSVNLPLLDNDQRADIGTEFKHSGQEAAIALGWEMLVPELKQQRQQQWLDFIQQNPGAFLYCFRGGLRSKITQQLIAEAGGQCPRVIGGYKALRQFLLTSLETLSNTTPLLVIAGRTCCGKTAVIEKLTNAIDLEGLAQHRGSAFGAQIQTQPTQINFENALAIKLLKHEDHNKKLGKNNFVAVEDEGKLIGRLALPPSLKNKMRQSPLVEVQTSLEQRVDIAVKDYVIDSLAEYRLQHGEDLGLKVFAENLLKNLARIKKRLGGVNYQKIHSQFENAIDELKQFDRVDAFALPIQTLLRDYYDPMYDYQRTLNQGKLLFKGDIASVVAWVQENASLNALEGQSTAAEINHSAASISSVAR